MTTASQIWLNLPAHLWKDIFSRLKPVIAAPPDLPIWSAGFPSFAAWYTDEASHAWFRRLPLTCKRFHEVFVRNKQLTSILYLRRCLAGQQVLKMLQWIRTHGEAAAVNSLVAECSPWVETFLGALHAYPTHLTSAHLRLKNDTAIQLLGGFNNITQLHIFVEEDEDESTDMSLEALCGLKGLRSLTLTHGSYTHVNAAAHLTVLELSRCRATCCEFSPSAATLTKLSLSRSRLVHFHESGVSGCSGLQSLSFVHSRMPPFTAFAALNIFDQHASKYSTMLDSMAALTCLSSLTITDHCPVQRVSLEWLGQLTALRKLQIRLRCSQMPLPEQLTHLKNLQMLSVAFYDSGPVVRFSVTGLPFHH